MVSIPPGSSLGRYVLIEQIGRGGMATVFRAHDPNLDRHVAVKVLPSFHNEDPTFLDRFRQEAQTVARLRRDPSGSIEVVTESGDEYCASAVVLAVGSTYRRLNVKGFVANQVQDGEAILVPAFTAPPGGRGLGVGHEVFAAGRRPYFLQLRSGRSRQ